MTHQKNENILEGREGPGLRSDAPARLLIVDDNDHVRESLKILLEDEPDFRIVGEAADGRKAVELTGRLRPDLILMDVRMPDVDGLAATREIKRRFPRVGVLILTVHESQDYMLDAIRAGAAGYTLKDAPQEQLTADMQKVLGGETVLSQNLATRLLERLAKEEPRDERVSPELPPRLPGPALTARENQVLELVALGKTNRQIAGDLVISTGTVKRHVETIIAKLGVSDRTQAVVFGLRLGLISLSADHVHRSR